jgi:hypothetical protein
MQHGRPHSDRGYSSGPISGLPNPSAQLRLCNGAIVRGKSDAHDGCIALQLARPSHLRSFHLRAPSLLADADIRIPDKHPAVNRLANLPVQADWGYAASAAAPAAMSWSAYY